MEDTQALDKLLSVIGEADQRNVGKILDLIFGDSKLEVEVNGLIVGLGTEAYPKINIPVNFSDDIEEQVGKLSEAKERFNSMASYGIDSIENFDSGLGLMVELYDDESIDFNKISMIKNVRALTGIGLREAKHFVEDQPDSRSILIPEIFSVDEYNDIIEVTVPSDFKAKITLIRKDD